MKFFRTGIFILLITFVGSATAKTSLTIYTSFEARDIKRYTQAFEKKHPDINLNWVRDSNGVITAKILAEKNNPQADAVWGIAASSLLIFKNERLIEAYKPKGIEKLDSKFYDSNNPPYWVAFDAYASALCVNKVELKKHKLPMPKSWADLTNPIYKGHLRMPNPASSGTGFLAVSAWLQIMGEKKAWEFMKKLDKNVNTYTHSGTKPCRDAARGEVTMGLSFANGGVKSKEAGAPIEIVIPTEGIGWEAEAAAMIKGTDYPNEVKKLLDFAISTEMMKMYSDNYPILGIPSMAKPVKNYPTDVVKRMIKNDFEWIAANRDSILHTWKKLFDKKSEKK